MFPVIAARVRLGIIRTGMFITRYFEGRLAFVDWALQSVMGLMVRDGLGNNEVSCNFEFRLYMSLKWRDMFVCRYKVLGVSCNG